MKTMFQVYFTTLMVLMLSMGCHAQQNTVKLTGKYKQVPMGKSVFKQGLTMLGREQDEYARQLTSFALNQIISQKGNQASLESARKYIGLALHLSPKNKNAVVANIQLSKGIFPKNVKKGYNKMTFSTLLYARAKIQSNEEGAQNKLLAHCFTKLAADLNPHNEDAIFSAEMMDQENGKLDWTQFTGK